MGEPSDYVTRANLETLFEKLLEAGWLTKFGFNASTGRYFVEWTAKGRERARWVNLIGDELHLGPKGLRDLLTICDKYAPHE